MDAAGLIATARLEPAKQGEIAEEHRCRHQRRELEGLASAEQPGCFHELLVGGRRRRGGIPPRHEALLLGDRLGVGGLVGTHQVEGALGLLATVFEHGGLLAVEPDRLQPEELPFLVRLVALVDRLVGLPEILRGVLILEESDARAPQQSCGEHAGGTRGADRDRAPLGELLAHHGQHRRPEESLADAVDGGGHDAHHAPLGVAEERQTEGSEKGRQGEQTERRDPLDDRAGEEPEDEHQRRGVDEKEQTVGRAGHDAAGDLADPGVGAELDVADQRVDEKEEGEHRIADLPAGRRAEAHEQGRAGGSREPKRELEIALEKEREQCTDHRGPEHAEFPEHVTVGDARRACLALREPLAEEHQPVDRDRNEEQRNLDLP